MQHMTMWNTYLSKGLIGLRVHLVWLSRREPTPTPGYQVDSRIMSTLGQLISWHVVNGARTGWTAHQD